MKVREKTRLLRNRKGGEPPAQAWYFSLLAFFLVMLMIMMMVMISSYQRQKLVINQDLVRDIYIQRALNSPTCFAFFDEKLQRTYPGVISPSKFNDAQLKECYKICNAGKWAEEDSDSLNCLSNFGFEFVLTNLETGAESSAKTENFESSSKSYLRPVLIRTGAGLQRGTMLVRVQETLAALQFMARKNV